MPAAIARLTFTDADIEADLSDDYQPVISAINRLSAIPINGYTNIAAGIDEGVDGPDRS